jgi:hypothetical protein
MPLYLLTVFSKDICFDEAFNEVVVCPTLLMEAGAVFCDTLFSGTIHTIAGTDIVSHGF